MLELSNTIADSVALLLLITVVNDMICAVGTFAAEVYAGAAEL